MERRANQAYEAYRARGRMKDGRRFGGPPNPYMPPDLPAGKVNVTDPDSRPIPIGFGFVQGFNAQAAVNEQHIVLAAEITNNSTDFSQLDPMVDRHPRRARAGRRRSAARSDRCRRRLLERAAHGRRGRQQAHPGAGRARQGQPRYPQARLDEVGRYDWMRTVLGSDYGRERYKKRKQTTEPTFGNTKHNKGVIRFHRRGRTKVRTEWRLMMMTENLTKVHRHQIATARA